MSTVNGFQVGSETLKYNYESLENYNTPEFSTTKTYAVGDYVMYQGKLYKCTTAVTTAGSWSSSNWTLAVLSDDVSSINNALEAKDEELYNGVYPISYDAYIVTNGETCTFEKVPSNVAKCYVIPVVDGSKYVITGKGLGSARLYAFVRENGQIISNSAADYIATDEVITAPEDCFLICNFRLDYGTAVVKSLYNIADNGERIDTGLKNIYPTNIQQAKIGRNLFNKYSATSGKYINVSTGAIVDGAAYSVSEYIPVSASTKYRGAYNTGYAWYDSSKKYISGASSNINATSPANAAYLRFYVATSNIDKACVYEGGIASTTDYSAFMVEYPWFHYNPDLMAYDFMKYGSVFVNMFNKDDAVDGEYVESTNGTFNANNAYFRSKYIPVEANVEYRVSRADRYAVYDEKYNYIEGGRTATFTIPANGKYLVVTAGMQRKAEYMLAKATDYPPAYESYGAVVPWIKSPKSKYAGKKMVCFGDSITNMGYTDDIYTATGIIAENVGLSSGRYANTQDPVVSAFSFYNIVYAIANDDWTIPDSIEDESGYETQYAQIQKIKAIDFTEIDFVSIAYGTNDFSSGTEFDNESNLYDPEYFKGAMRYCIKTLLETYPNLKIIIATPCYRFWQNSGVFVDDCDTHEIDGKKLSDYVNAEIEVCNEMHMPYVDNLTNGGINSFNRTEYFDANDGLHPIKAGRTIIGNRISDGLLANY